MQGQNRSVTIANDRTIIDLINGAQNRLIVVAPALNEPIAKALCKRWRALGESKVNVILDVDPEVYRLGYGDVESLVILEEMARNLGTMLNRQKGLRIGLIIADEKTMIYAPTPRLIEAGPSLIDKPNAIFLDSAPSRTLEELGQSEVGVKKQTVGLDKATIAEIREVRKILEENPPQKFDIARKVRVFNAAFEFVEFELLGTSIDRKTVPIPKHLSGVADMKTREQLRTSFTILPPDHKLSGTHLEKDKSLIAKKYLRRITGYGNVVLRSRKLDFEREVELLKDAVDRFAEEVRTKLQTAMDKNRENLFRSMLPLVKRSVPKDWLKSNGSKPDVDTLKQFLDDDLRRAFGTADKLIKNMKVRLVFKGVTFESLTNEDFIKIARESIPELSKIYDEFDAAKAEDLDNQKDNGEQDLFDL